MPRANVTVRSVKVTPVEGSGLQPFLYVDIKIECPICGGVEGTVFGHHLRTLHKAIGLVIENNQDLCGDAGEITDTLEFEGMGADPEKGRYN